MWSGGIIMEAQVTIDLTMRLNSLAVILFWLEQQKVQMWM